MNLKKIQLRTLAPVFMSFMVMGFVDIVGVSTGYIQNDFGLSDDLAQLVPAMAFLWFFLLSVPVGILQDKFGKKNLLNIGMAVTGLGMIVPFLYYTFPVMLGAFVLLGIGNTIVQVSANPLLHDVTPKEKFASYMSLTQFAKAVISLLGPIITTFVASRFGDWKLVFAVYAVTSFLAVLWLYFTPIEEYKPDREPATFKSCFSLLSNKLVLLMVLAIFLVVGADVGMNSNIQNYLTTKFGVSLAEASLGISIYFTALMISRFLGAILLNWLKAKPFLIGTALVALFSVGVMIWAPSPFIAKAAIFMIGMGAGNLFPLIFSITVNKMPDRANEISGLMIMAVSGGAIIPPLMGIMSKNFGVIASLFVLVACMFYILFVSLNVYKRAG